MTTEQQRKKNRERQQRLRDRKKYDRQEAEYADRVNSDGLARRIRENKTFLGEVSPGVDATNLQDALQVAREMGRALGIDDFAGGSLLDYERKVFDAWVERGGPFLNRQTQQVSPGWSRQYWSDHGGFDSCWEALPGSDQEIDAGSIPPLGEQKYGS